MPQRVLAFGIIAGLPFLAAAALNCEILDQPSAGADCITLVAGTVRAALVVADQEEPVVHRAADLLADDVQRVSGQRPVVTNSPAAVPQLIIAGTLGQSPWIQTLVAGGKLKDLDTLRGRWEATRMEVVEQPFPGVERALVIVGSDRRGTAYGLMHLSEKIGVSPWYWWADVPPRHRDVLAIRIAAPQLDAPAVKYRGCFINDEDWGLFPWASKTFDPEFKNIGPKTYARVFELMLRLRLNYLWPAMHPCSAEFGSVPENVLLADQFGIVAGSSHCEPMLCNNVHWNEQERGRWNYSLNRDAIYSYWEDNVKARRSEEAVWTIGIRGIHDAGMERPPNDLPGRIKLMSEVFHDQRALLDRYVTRKWGAVAQCFVPYKEVLPIYDAGLPVPDDVTLVWVDDNFGYLRRLSSPAERKRSGGAGVYWHLSYYGGPHSYTWINTTAPAFMWEELHKAWENDARTIWVINVGDLKPMEIGIDYFSRLAWNPDGLPLGMQRQFLTGFAAANFGEKFAAPTADLLMDFYRLGTVRKPELMERNWALSLTEEEAKQLADDYQTLLERERALADAMPPAARDAFTELVGFPVQVLGAAGQIFLADRHVQRGENVSVNAERINQLRSDLERQVENYNTKLAGGKWNHIMPGLVTGKNLMAWNSQVRWPWGEKPASSAHGPVTGDSVPAGLHWRDAATADRQIATGPARWSAVEGLGPSGRAMVLQPANLAASWKDDDAAAPMLEFDFAGSAGDAEAWVDFLPTFRLCPGMKLRVAVSLDDGAGTMLEVPGSSGAENENGRVRSQGVQDNYVRARVPLPALAAGRHTFKIRAVDPGAVIDRLALP